MPITLRRVRDDYVENFNPFVCLFERLGFARASAMDFQILLERRPLGLPLPEPGIARDSKDG